MKNYRGEMSKKYDTMKFNKAGNSFDYVEEEMEEGNAFTDALRKTKKGEKFKLGNKEYMDRSSLEEDETIYEFEVNESDICECGGLKMEGECSECGMKEYSLLELEEDMYDNMEKTSVTYWLNQLQNLKIDKDIFLNTGII